jgi:hypothetical protein
MKSVTARMVIPALRPEPLCSYAEAVFGATSAYLAGLSHHEVNRDILGPGAAALNWSMKVSELLAQVAVAGHVCSGYLAALAET